MKKYDSYKDSGIKWLGEIPSHWTCLKTRYALCGLQDGTHGTFERTESGYPLLSAKNVFDNGIHIEDKESFISKSDYNSIVANGFPKKGDVALCCVGTIGRCCLYSYEYPMAFQRSVTFLRPSKELYSTYLCYYLKSNIFAHQLSTGAKTSAQSGIYLSDIANTLLLLPPLYEQEAISEYLDEKCGKIDALIEAKEKQITDMVDYRRAIINDSITNIDINSSEYLKLKYFASLITTPSSNQKKIGLENIESSTGKFVETDSTFEGNGIEFYENDIIYGKLRPYLQKVWQATFCGNAVGDFFVFRTKDNCHASFLKYLMISSTFTSLANGSTYGAKMPRVASDFILNMKWRIPSVEKQIEIAAYLDEKTAKIDAVVEQLQGQIADLKDLKAATISDAVTGKVDVRDWK